jgi:D-3-phosphoglycerate dehydrogenase
MSQQRVLISDYAWPDVEIERGILAQGGAELVVAPASDLTTLCGLAGGVDAIMTCWAPIPAEVIKLVENCCVVARLGIGLDNIDVDFCTRQGIPVTNVPDYCQVEVAEHTLALLLALARNIGIFHQDARQGVYARDHGPPLLRLAGRTLGLVGLGGIGRMVADKAAGLGLRVIATRRDLSRVSGEIPTMPLGELLAQSDFISLHLPLDDTNNQLIGGPELAMMKPGSFLINTARGGLVDHQALAAALESGQLAGAALDVQDPEPPPLDKPPYNHPHVIVTPHSAFISEESLLDLRTRASNQVVQCLHGEVPDNLVNPEVLRC